MKRCILACWLLLCPLIAFAQANTAVLTCTAPTTNTDGSAISAAQKPLTFKFADGTTLGTYPNVSPPQTACAFTFTGLTAGTHFFVASVTDKLGATSGLSMSAGKQVVNPTPQPPTALTVAADPTAYEIRTTGGVLVASRIGRVELGTMCTQETQTVAGVKYNRIATRDADFINWPAASPSTVKVFARCG